MSFTPRDMNDAVDASFEMPENYGSRGLWRFNNLRAFIGLVAIPILFGLQYVDRTTLFAEIVTILGLLTVVFAVVWFVRRDRVVQRRIDTTGIPLEVEEPF
ncbi:MAG: hypothetical protein ABIO43_02565 [Sphingomicrobium sp.]